MFRDQVIQTSFCKDGNTELEEKEFTQIHISESEAGSWPQPRCPSFWTKVVLIKPDSLWITIESKGGEGERGREEERERAKQYKIWKKNFEAVPEHSYTVAQRGLLIMQEQKEIKNKRSSLRLKKIHI